MARFNRIHAVLALTCLLLAPAASAGPRSPDEAELGKAAFPEIVGSMGGIYESPELTRYVTRIGLKLAGLTDQADEEWTFTILDSPVANAFSTPGGYIYVTRGVLALANDEAELAAVLGHEIAHVTAGHGAERQADGKLAGLGVLFGAVVGGLANGKEGLQDGLEMGARLAMGYTAQHSQEQEFEADSLGIELITRAGYDPQAQADFLSQLAAQQELDARMADRAYNPNKVSFFASHPATGDRIDKASDQAGNAGGLRSETAYMTAIDGMIYGDSAAQGFVRGRTFSHPGMAFTLTVPPDFVITNSSNSVFARGPDKASFKLEGSRDTGQSLSGFITRKWLPGLAKSRKLGKPGPVETLTINGQEAARVTVPARNGNARIMVQLTAVRSAGQIMRLTAVWPAGARQTRTSLEEAAATLRRLDAGEVGALTPLRIQTYAIRPGDTADLLAASMPVTDFATDIFLTNNGLRADSELVPGDLVKLIAD